jgi:hypothetical protein
VQFIGDMAGLLRHFDGPGAEVLQTNASGGGRGESDSEILDIESERSQLLAEAIVQFPRNAATLLLLCGDELGGERANLGAIDFRQRSPDAGAR